MYEDNKNYPPPARPRTSFWEFSTFNLIVESFVLGRFSSELTIFSPLNGVLRRSQLSDCKQAGSGVGVFGQSPPTAAKTIRNCRQK